MSSLIRFRPRLHMPEIVLCRVCGRKLTNPRSVAVSMGPVCVRRLGVLFDDALQYAQSIGRQLDVGIIQNLSVMAAANAYQMRLRRGSSNQPNIPEDQDVEMYSISRDRQEHMRIEFDDANHGRAISQSGSTYNVTGQSCTCPDYIYRHQHHGTECRHIEAFNIARGNSQVHNVGQTPEEIARMNLRAEIDRLQPVTSEVLVQAEQGFHQINWVEDEIREHTLDVWRQNRAFDGIYMSENDAAWNELHQQAGEDWNYRYENVLGGTGNSFGIEIEFELEHGASQREIAQALAREGISDGIQRGYHSTAAPGMWKLERDGSLTNGMELVSPILFDRREDWERIERATKILKENGAKISNRCGGHIHVGIGPLDHRTYSWQRLARIGVSYEKLFYRMGGADADQYQTTRERGTHRGTYYSARFKEGIVGIRGESSAADARSLISPGRYTIFNCTNVDSRTGAKPTLEMRYPNGSLNHKQWQAQIQVANAVVHQAAVIRNDSPQSAFTPGLMANSKHLRHTDRCTDATETEHFRKFLDVLGNPEDRLAATWLFLRGRA